MTLLEEMERMYKLAREGKLYPDMMVAAESWYRFRMGDEAFDEAFNSGRLRETSVDGVLELIQEDLDGNS